MKSARRPKVRSAKAAALLCAAIAVACVLFLIGQNNAAPAEFERAEVVRVVDGDTLIIDRGQGDERLRLIGIDAPESVHPDSARNTSKGKSASEHLKVALPQGSSVWLQTDTSDTDRYGRLLRYVWLEEPADPWNASEITHKMLNAVLVTEGYAEPKEYPPDTMYADILERL